MKVDEKPKHPRDTQQGKQGSDTSYSFSVIQIKCYTNQMNECNYIAQITPAVRCLVIKSVHVPCGPQLPG